MFEKGHRHKRLGTDLNPEQASTNNLPVFM